MFFFCFCLLLISCNSIQLRDSAKYPTQLRNLEATADPFSSKPASSQLDSDYFDEQFDAIRIGMITMMLELKSFVRAYTMTAISTRQAKTQNFADDISKVQGKLNDLAASLEFCPMRFSRKLGLKGQSGNLQRTYTMLSSDVAILLSGGDPTSTSIYSGAAYGIGLADGTPIEDEKVNPFDSSLAEQKKDYKPVNPFSVPRMSMFSPPSAPTVVLAQNMEVNTPSVSESAKDAASASLTV